ncbi:MAG: DUF4973 domain-containing protein [Bacteroides sp.]|jgi:hypothetical protein|nr:DUF4973 domain-containing protein [Bacteroides sp.]MCI1681695.1 DUF4973 domain-containing protein [Bacteroides sp.]
MKKIYSLLVMVAALALCGSCNDEWKNEQYEHYISFKAPIDAKGVTPVYIRYKVDGAVTYKLPLIVSGSTTNDQNITVHVAVDSDTLQVLNYERFQNRTDLFYKELDAQYFTIPETVDIKKGENTSLLNIDFTLKDLDLVNKWVLPLTIVDSPSYIYKAHPRKNYRKALLRIMPFNDYSGAYSSTTLNIYLKGSEDDASIVQNTKQLYVSDETSVFFYAGTVDEDRTDRANYKIYVKFDPNSNNLTFTVDNPLMEFQLNRSPSYTVDEEMDATRPYLLHRYVTIRNIDYNYTDYTLIPNAKVEYTVRGTMILERKINTQIPDEDQAIEW